MAAFKIIFLYFICFLKSTCLTLCISHHMASSYQDKSPTHTFNLLSSSAEEFGHHKLSDDSVVKSWVISK